MSRSIQPTATHHAGLIGLLVLLVFVAVVALDVAGVILVVRLNRRLSRAARIVVAVVAAWTVVVALALFVQNAGDWGGAIATSSFIVLYGLIACGAVILVDSVVRRFRRPRAVSA